MLLSCVIYKRRWPWKSTLEQLTSAFRRFCLYDSMPGQLKALGELNFFSFVYLLCLTIRTLLTLAVISYLIVPSWPQGWKHWVHLRRCQWGLWGPQFSSKVFLGFGLLNWMSLITTFSLHKLSMPAGFFSRGDFVGNIKWNSVIFVPVFFFPLLTWVSSLRVFLWHWRCVVDFFRLSLGCLG